MNAIECEAVVRTFGPVRAVDGISFAVPSGSIFTLLGANGAGKTTTIHLLLGLLHPDSGRLAVLGEDPRQQGDRIRSQAGALLEHHGLYERLTVLANLGAFGRITRMPAADRAQRIRELLERFHLWDRRDAAAGTLSKGMKQKLAVARALLHRPRILFLDEPTSGLDPEAAVDLRQMIASLADDGTTVFLNTHNLADAEKLSTTVAIMRAGKLLAIGSPAEILSSVNTGVTITGSGFSNAVADRIQRHENVADVALTNGSMMIRLRTASSVAPIVRELVESGVAIEEVRRQSGGLEEAFLHIVREERP